MDLFAPFAPTTLVLLAARIGGLVLIAPLFSARTIPVRVRTAVVIVLTWLLHPLALSATQAPALTPAQFLVETLIGFAVGLGAAILIGAAETMGDLISVSMGLSGAAALDPVTNQNSVVLGQFASLFALTLMLSMNAHVEILGALARTLELVPVGSAIDVQAGLGSMISLGSTLFLIGLRFAAPVIAIGILANVALAVLNRVAPHVNILAVAFSIQIGMGLMALSVALPLIATYFTGWQPTYEGMLGQVVDAMVGRGAR